MSALDVVFYASDLDKEITIREYLKTLLQRLWIEGEGFSGKRPLGDSGWDWNIVAGLVKSGLVPGTLDQDGYVDDADWDKSNEVMEQAIEDL